MITLSSTSLPTSTVVSKAKNLTSPPPKNHKPAMTGPTCMVCHDVAPKDTVFRRHYGVICCEACKCFFRRTVQMNRDYKCRFGSSCSIGRSAENLKQVCQACRFNQCIQAGMKLNCKLMWREREREREFISVRIVHTYACTCASVCAEKLWPKRSQGKPSFSSLSITLPSIKKTFRPARTLPTHPSSS